MQIILSALSTGGFIGAIIQNEYIYTVLGGIFSTILLGFNLFFKEFSLIEEINDHSKAANELWLIREQYISLLTDFDSLSINEIKDTRDCLQKRVHDIYCSTPKTDSKSYKEAQEALKVGEEQFFSNSELNQMLPPYLRSKKEN